MYRPRPTVEPLFGLLCNFYVEKRFTNVVGGVPPLKQTKYSYNAT